MIELKRATPEGHHCFFGYYDKSPWNLSKEYLLFGETTVYGRQPRENEPLSIGVVHLNTNKAEKLAVTPTWNFQQGCMMQWLDDECFIYNSCVGKDFVSKIFDLKTRKHMSVPKPVYAISHDKSIIMTVDFARIQQYRQGYGYLGGEFDPNRDVAIESLNLRTGISQTLVSFTQFFELGYLKLGQSYWVDHILFSPDDSHITFLLRNLMDDGGCCSRLFCCAVNGQNLRCLLDTGMASHADWFDNEHFCIWGRRQNTVRHLQSNRLIRSVLKPMIQLVRRTGVPNVVRAGLYGDAFLKINIHSGKISPFATHIPANEGGGHFTFDKSKKWMLNDTSINSQGNRWLMLYYLPSDNRINLASIYTPVAIHNTAFRCDLHPRWSPDNQEICIDSVHEGYRAMYIADISQIIRDVPL